MGEEKGHTAKDRLVSKVANNIETAIRRQLMMMKFYQDEELDDIPQTPLSNLGCESEFGSVGNDLKKSGGAVSLTTVSNKHVIARNHLYDKTRWSELDGVHNLLHGCLGKMGVNKVGVGCLLSCIRFPILTGVKWKLKFSTNKNYMKQMWIFVQYNS